MVQYRRSTPRMEEGTMTNKQTLVGCEAPSTPWQPLRPGTPGYPERLFDDLVSLSGTGPGAKVLEIGCGTAQATVPLARRGYHVLCVELGDNLATIARGKLQSLFVGENETNGSHPLYGVGCRPGSTLGPPVRPDAAYAQTTWN